MYACTFSIASHLLLRPLTRLDAIVYTESRGKNTHRCKADKSEDDKSDRDSGYGGPISPMGR